MRTKQSPPPILIAANTHPDKTVLGLELHALTAVVDEREASGAATTEVGAHAEDDDVSLVGLVHGSQLLAQFVLADVGPGRVDHVKDHLPALEQTVGDELARAQGDGRGGVLKGTIRGSHRSAAIRRKQTE